MNIEQVVAEMPRAENPYHPNPLREFDHQITEAGRIGYAEAMEAQCQLLAEQGWHPPIEPLPDHCSSHDTFQDDCMGCQGMTSQYKGIDGKFYPIDWASFHLGQDIMLEQGYQKLRTQYEMVDWLRQKFPVLEEVCSIELLAQELSRWLLEGE